MPGVFRDPSPPYISGRIFQCNPESGDSASLASQFQWGSCLYLPSAGIIGMPPAHIMYVDAGGLWILVLM